MFKRLLALFLVAMLVVPAAAIAAGRSDTAASKPAGKNLERQDSQAATADGKSDDGDVGTRDRREKGSTTGKGGHEEDNDIDAAENNNDTTSTPTNSKLRKPVKRLKDIGFNGNSEDTDTKALRRAEKEAVKAAKKALKEERKFGSYDSSCTIENSGTVENTGTARGLQRAAAAITANIERMVEKFGCGTKKAQASLTRVLNKLNTWIERILAGGKKHPGNGSGSNDDTSTPNSNDDTCTPDLDDELECDEDTETSGTAGS